MPRIVHITDVHFGSDHATGVSAKPESTHYGKYVAQSPSEHIYKGLSNLNPKADLILLGGDYVTGRDSATSQIKDFDPCVQMLGQISKQQGTCLTAGVSNFSDRVLIVPGNHDIERGTAEPTKDFKAAFSDYLNPYTHSDPGNEIRQYAPLFVFQALKLAIYCLSTVELSGLKNEKIKLVTELLTKKIKSKKDAEIAYCIKTLEQFLFPDAPAIIEEHLKLFEKRNEAFRQRISDHAEYTKIILCHHPFLPVPDLEIKAYSHIIGGGRFLEILRNFDYRVVLHGHSHQSFLTFQEYIDEKRGLVHIGSPSFGSGSSGSDQNGLSVIDFEGKPIHKSMQIYRYKFDLARRTFEQVSGQNSSISFFDSKRSNNHEKSKSVDRILIDRDLVKLIAANRVIINGSTDRVNAASYDCALGYRYKKSEIVHTLKPDEQGDAATIILDPDETVYICTAEEFNFPKDMMGHATVLSRHMKNGLLVGISNFVDPGFKGHFFFPITNTSKNRITIAANEPIMSIKITQLEQDVEQGWAERKGRGGEPRKDF